MLSTVGLCLKWNNPEPSPVLFHLNHVLIHIPPDVYHATVNTGQEPMRLLAIYAPPGPEAELRAMEGVRIEPPERAS